MSRLTLEWFELAQKPLQDLRLKIPVCDVYSKIIDRAFPSLNHIPWREDTKGTCFTYIKLISPQTKQSLNNFLALLKAIRCLTPTSHLASHFQGDLDEAYALDFNFQQNVLPMAYSEVGALEHLAKALQDIEAIAEITNRLVEVIRSHPTLLKSDIIAAMPPRPTSPFHLPGHLVDGISAALGRRLGLQLTKQTEHPKLRDLPMDQKIAALKGVFKLHESVKGKSILIIDDLYQSGVSVWSLAKFLKENGAREVYALACVKSWGDTDNQQ